MIDEQKVKELELTANKIRQDIIKMLVAAGAGHSAGPLGMTDIFTALYFNVLKHDPKKSDWPDRDRLILSNGHICPVRYVAMHHAGYDITKEELLTFRKIGSRLEGHPSVKKIPELETTSGPLGEGTSVAAGIALGAKIDGRENDFHVWCLVSDAEQQEGMTWEGAMLAGKYKLSNLTVIIDRNNIQIDGVTEDVMPLEPLREKYESFGWHVMEMNGHDMREIVSTLEESKAVQEKPVFVIAYTVPGKGVDFMENDYGWHGIPPDEEQAKEALAQLEKREEELKQ
jgi:transketolase